MSKTVLHIVYILQVLFLISITASAAGDIPPSANAGPDQTVYAGDTVLFNSTGSSGSFVLPSYTGASAVWHMDEGAGTIAHDNTTYSNDGTLLNGAAWTTGKEGNGINFDGSDDYVRVPHDSSLDVTRWTIAAWIYPLPGAHEVLVRAPGGHLTYEMEYHEENHNVDIWFERSDDADYYVYSSVNSIPLNTWTHVTGTYDGSSIKVYINGVLDKSAAASATPNTGVADVYIGLGDHGAHFKGVIDEVAIYNRAISAGEVNTLYNGGSLAGIVSYEWDFDGDGINDYIETQASAPDGSFDGKTEHVYTTSGTYQSKLTITDSAGNTASDTATVTVNVLTIAHNLNTGLGYSKIQEAINAPETLNGHTIQIDAGTFIENIDVTKQITLIGAGKDETVIKAATPNDHGIDLRVNGITVKNLSVRGATGWQKAGIYIAVDNSILENIKSYNNERGVSTNSRAGTCWLYSNSYPCDITATNTKIINSTFTGNSWAGLMIYWGKNTQVINSTIAGNQNGISFYVSSNNHVTGSKIYSNSYDGIALGGSDTISNNEIYSNGRHGIESDRSGTIKNNNIYSNGGSGIYLNDGGSHTIIDNNITSNRGGSGIGILGGSDNNVVSGNRITDNKGEGVSLIYWSDSNQYDDDIPSNNVVKDNIISGNSLGVHIYQSSSNSIYNNILNNTNNFLAEYDNFPNTWNTAKQAGTNIIGGQFKGGNYWSKPDGTGYSETCTDSDLDGICDSAYKLNNANSDQFPLHHVNYLPVPEAGADQTVYEYDTVYFSGNFTDLNTDDTHTIEWDFGDGHISGTLTTDHVYIDEGIYNVTLTVTDNHGEVGVDNLSVTVINVEPAVTLIGDPGIDEGALYSLLLGHVTGNDPVLQYTVNWGDGASDTYPYETATTPANLLNNPSTETGSLSGWNIIANGGNGWLVRSGGYDGNYHLQTSYSWDKRSQEINLLAKGYTAAGLDAAPEITVSEWFMGGWPNYGDYYYMKVELRDGNHNVIDGWSTGTKTATSDWIKESHTFSNYGPGVRYIYFEDGGKDREYWLGHYGSRLDAASVTVDANSNSHTHVYTDGPATRIISVDLTDTDGYHTGSGNLSLVVNNIPPAADAGADLTINERDSVTFSGSLTDPGSVDTHTIEWDFGDSGNASGTLTPSHVYTSDGIFTVTLTVTDNNGGTDTDTATVTVIDTDPSIPLTGYASVDEGAAYTVNLGSPVNIMGIEFEFESYGWYDGNHAYIYVDGIQRALDTRGMNVVRTDENGNYVESRTYDTYLSAAESDKLAAYLNSLTAGDIVIIAVRDEASRYLNLNAKNAIKALGSEQIDSLNYRDGWGLISVVGDGKKSENHVAAQSGSATGTWTKINSLWKCTLNWGDGTSETCFDMVNLLNNPGGETGSFSGWSILANSNDGWKMGNNGGQEGTYYFKTGYPLDKRAQTIDLQAKGYSASQLDTAPEIHVSEWVVGSIKSSCFWNDDDYYYLKAELRDENQNVIDAWNSGLKKAATSWRQEKHIFKDYGSGVRYIYFEDGGRYTFADYAIGCGAYLDSAFAGVALGDISGSLTHVYADGPLTSNITVDLQDETGIFTGVGNLPVIVNNVAPTVNAGADKVVNESQTVYFSGTFTDPGLTDTHTIVWDFGDGTTSTGTLRPNRHYAEHGVYNVTLTVTDNSGASVIDNLTVTVNHEAKTVHNINTGLDYWRIQDAINAPQTANGHTIRLENRTYTENIDITKVITLEGAGRDVTIIRAAGNDHVIDVKANGVIIRNLMITGAPNMAGVNLENMDNSRVENSIIQNNKNGVVIKGGSDQNTISGNTISDNSGEGIAIIYLPSSCNYCDQIPDGNIIKDNIIKGNGFGIQVYQTSGNSVYNNFFNNSNNFLISYTNFPNSWNTGKHAGRNIIGGAYKGGNYWAKPDGTGFSETCTDGDGDGICDTSYELDCTDNSNRQYCYAGNPGVSPNIDQYPLTFLKLVLPTPADENVIVENNDTGISLTFDSVVDGGETNVTISTTGPASPHGFQLSGIYYDISTSASFTGTVSLCINYDEALVGNEANLKLMHFENNEWIDVTTSLDTNTNVICGSVTGFSPFAVAELVDTGMLSTTLDISGVEGNNGWYVSDVSATLIVSGNPGSAVIEYSMDGVNWNTYENPIAFTNDGKTVIYYHSIDNDGNVETTRQRLVKIDKTLPEITGTRTAANEAGWNNDNVTVTFECSDAISGVESCTADTIVSDEGADLSITGSVSDTAGNTASVTIGGINIDKTPPGISTYRTPANEFGWNNDSVTVWFECSDTLSGIESCEPDTVVSGEGEKQNIIGTATDIAGNTASVTAGGINIDLTPPVISGTRTAANEHGWNNGDVTVYFDCREALSGIYSCTPGTVVQGDGTNLYVTGNAYDLAGNSAVTTVDGINIDRTLPEVTIISPVASDYIHSASIVIDFTASDEIPGIDSVTASLDGIQVTNGQVIDLRTLALGQHTMFVEATDLASNINSESVTFNVKPVTAIVDIDPDTLNINSQGKTITAYIELAEGHDVSAIDAGSVILSTDISEVQAESAPVEFGDHDGDGIPDMMLKFNRQDLAGIVDAGDEITLTVTGFTDGAAFRGSDVIRVIEKGDTGSKDTTSSGERGQVPGNPGNSTNSNHTGTNTSSPPANTDNMGNEPDKDNKKDKQK